MASPSPSPSPRPSPSASTKTNHDLESKMAMMCIDKATHNALHSPLLKLAAELRNKIYRYALVEDGYIRIWATRPLPVGPPLLLACRQITEEAASIYWCENRFALQIHDLDVTRIVKWLEGTGRHPKRADVSLTGACNWTNLLFWLKSYHENKCSRAPVRRSNYPYTNSSIDKMERVTVRMFDVVDKAKAQEMSWSVVEDMLEPMHQAIAVLDPDWT